MEQKAKDALVSFGFMNKLGLLTGLDNLTWARSLA